MMLPISASGSRFRAYGRDNLKRRRARKSNPVPGRDSVVASEGDDATQETARRSLLSINELNTMRIRGDIRVPMCDFLIHLYVPYRHNARPRAGRSIGPNYLCIRV